jgi:hypothetical protein
LKWYKDDEEIMADERHIFEREPDGVYKLCIHKPDVEDSGKYRCTAKNVAGTAKVIHDVFFKGKKQAIRASATGIRHADPKIPRVESPEPEPELAPVELELEAVA